METVAEKDAFDLIDCRQVKRTNIFRHNKLKCVMLMRGRKGGGGRKNSNLRSKIAENLPRTEKKFWIRA